MYRNLRVAVAVLSEEKVVGLLEYVDPLNFAPPTLESISIDDRFGSVLRSSHFQIVDIRVLQAEIANERLAELEIGVFAAAPHRCFATITERLETGVRFAADLTLDFPRL